MENIVSAIYEIHCDALLIKNEDENLSKPLRQNYFSKVSPNSHIIFCLIQNGNLILKVEEEKLNKTIFKFILLQECQGLK